VSRSPDRLERSVIEPRNPVLNVSRGRNLPHSPSIRVGDLLFISGMSSLDPVTGERKQGPIGAQVHQVFANVAHLLEGIGIGLDRIVKVHMMVADIGDHDGALAAFGEIFPGEPPACTLCRMQQNGGSGVEIECIAAL
jgi:enamine deaminase RidA (YjgF/YER057c/UK114 family)